jgi:hypothetical protein
MTKRLSIAIALSFAASALIVACNDKNQTPTKTVVGDGSTAGHESSGGRANVGGRSSVGGTDAPQGGTAGASPDENAGAPSGTAGTAGSAGISGTAGQAGAVPCLLSGKGCYDCKQRTLPEHFLNQCPIPGVACEPFDNSRVPK